MLFIRVLSRGPRDANQRHSRRIRPARCVQELQNIINCEIISIYALTGILIKYVCNNWDPKQICVQEL